MSEQDYDRVFETPKSEGSAAQATFLERTTIAMLGCGALASTIAVVFTIIEGSRFGTL